MNSTPTLRTTRHLFLTAVFLCACGSDDSPGERAQATSDQPQTATNLPPGHPPIDPHAGLGTGSRGLKPSGQGSLEELARAREATSNAEAADLFAEGFRLIFAQNKAARDYSRAKQLFEQALELDPQYAEAHRGLGYARFNISFDFEGAVDEYQKAIELKPEYGEAHYALAFMYAMNDLDVGRQHFRRAMELGIEDEHDLGGQFYGGDD